MNPTGANPNITWKWLGVTVFLVLVGLAGAWANDIQGQVSQSRKDSSSQAADIAVIKEKLRVIEDNQREQREVSRETIKRLDEVKDLLRKR